MNLLTTAKVAVNTAKTWTKVHAPELLFGGGVISFGLALYSATKAGSKTEAALEEHHEKLEEVKYNEESTKTDVAKVYFHTAGELTKDYAPAIGFASVSLVCFGASYGILKKRYVAISAAYTALQESFKLYRQRVIEDKGKEADMYYMTGQKPKTITVTNEETGEKQKKKVYPTLPDGSIASPYAFKFSKYKENGEKNNMWQNDRHINETVIMGMQDYFNNVLYARCEFDDDHNVIKKGIVLLNEIRDSLGEDPTDIGMVVGNRFGNGEPGSNGYIDFNLVESKETDPETGREISCFWIDPNVDGLVYGLMESYEDKPFKANANMLEDLGNE